MSVSEFWMSVVASIVAATIVAVVARVTLLHMKQIVIGGLTTITIVAAVSLLVFSAMTVTNQFFEYHEKRSVQEKIDLYLRGNYPREYEQGYRIDVTEIKQRVLLGFIYPGYEAYPSPHPLNNYVVTSALQKLLNDNGYPGTPVWAYQMKPLSRDQLDQMLEPDWR